MLYGRLLLRPWEVERLTPREVVAMTDAYGASLAMPGSPVWALAIELNAQGCKPPVTADILLGRPLK